VPEPSGHGSKRVISKGSTKTDDTVIKRTHIKIVLSRTKVNKPALDAEPSLAGETQVMQAYADAPAPADAARRSLRISSKTSVRRIICKVKGVRLLPGPPRLLPGQNRVACTRHRPTQHARPRPQTALGQKVTGHAQEPGPRPSRPHTLEEDPRPQLITRRSHRLRVKSKASKAPTGEQTT
jgi:hypothetical protein